MVKFSQSLSNKNRVGKKEREERKEKKNQAVPCRKL